MTSLPRTLTDGERDILHEIERDATPTDLIDAPEPRCYTCGDEGIACPDCRPFIPPAPFELDGRDRPRPDPIDAAWEAGYQEGRDRAEQRIHDLEYTTDRLETMLGDARAELIGRGR